MENVFGIVLLSVVLLVFGGSILAMYLQDPIDLGKDDER